MNRRLLAPSLAIAAVLTGPTGAAEVEAALWRQLAEQGRVRVLVAVEAASADAPRKRSQRVAAVLADLSPAEFRATRRFANLALVAGTVSAAGLERLRDDERVVRIDRDPSGGGNLAQGKPLAGITPLQGAGFDGAGLTVAIVDTGIDTDHPDFAGRIVDQQCFCQGCCPGGGDTQSGAGAAEDDHGHGTNVAGIALGGGAVALTGAAPAADVIAVKVMDANNTFCCASDPIAGLDWLISNHPEVDVVNMSLGTFATFAGDCDSATAFTMGFAQAVDTLRGQGTAVIVSSGNQGLDGFMEAPACVANAISVGAVWDADLGVQTHLGCTQLTAVDAVTCFSNTSATTDLFAPGAFILASGRGGGQSIFGGTSQAAPLVAGCIALMMDARPGASLNAIEAALKATGASVTDPSSLASYPRIDCDLATTQLDEIFADGFE